MPFSGIFGSLVDDPEVVMPPYQACIINFPRRGANELAELRVEIEQMRPIVSGTPARQGEVGVLTWAVPAGGRAGPFPRRPRLASCRVPALIFRQRCCIARRRACAFPESVEFGCAPAWLAGPLMMRAAGGSGAL